MAIGIHGDHEAFVCDCNTDWQPTGPGNSWRQIESCGDMSEPAEYKPKKLINTWNPYPDNIA
jgi:hypothetical protein